MNADTNMTYKRTSQPRAVDGGAINGVARWVRANGSRQIRKPDPRQVMIERYPAGLFSDDEMQALWEVIRG